MLEEQYESELVMFASRESAIEAARVKGEEIIKETYLSNRNRFTDVDSSTNADTPAQDDSGNNRSADK